MSYTRLLWSQGHGRGDPPFSQLGTLRGFSEWIPRAMAYLHARANSLPVRKDFGQVLCSQHVAQCGLR